MCLTASMWFKLNLCDTSTVKGMDVLLEGPMQVNKNIGQVQSPVPGTDLSSAMAQGWEPALVKRTCGSQ